MCRAVVCCAVVVLVVLVGEVVVRIDRDCRLGAFEAVAPKPIGVARVRACTTHAQASMRCVACAVSWRRCVCVAGEWYRGCVVVWVVDASCCPRGPMDKASAYEAGDCGFESRRRLSFALLTHAHK